MDLNFGIKKWYLQPSFIVRVFSILISLCFIYYIILNSIRVNNSIWKEAIGKSQVIVLLLIFIFTVLSIILFMMYYFKYSPNHNSIILFSLIGALLAEFIIVSIYVCFSTESVYKTNCKKLDEYLKQTHKTITNCTIEEFAKERTNGPMIYFLLLSFLWFVSMFVSLYYTLWEQQIEKLANSQNVSE